MLVTMDRRIIRPATAALVALALPAAAQPEGLELAARALERAAQLAGPDAAPAEPAAPPNLALRNTALLGTAAALIAAYGFENWWQDGFGGGFKTESEGWFGADTKYGGADKLGHLYGNYVGVRLLTPLFEALGNGRESSVSLASWSTFIAYSAVEVIDGYSNAWKFSREDFVANTAGVLLGYAMEANPRLDEILDFRLAYRQSAESSHWDAFGDYSGQRYFVVAKADAFEALRAHPVTRYLELSVGYGTTGYSPPAGIESTPKRTWYVGLGLNLSRLLADGFYGGARKSTPFQKAADVAFDFVQFPTYAATSKDIP